MTVHNHGIDPSCKERTVGECLLKPGVVVLDLDGLYDQECDFDWQYVIKTLRSEAHGKATRNAIADQIEAQTKPPRIPEPSKYGVVIASSQGVREEYVSEGKAWRGLDSGSFLDWEDLEDPVLVREGV
jgi:hypothetical protein